jgi:hypothetical protein
MSDPAESPGIVVIPGCCGFIAGEPESVWCCDAAKTDSGFRPQAAQAAPE